MEGETGSYSKGRCHAQQIFNPIFCQWVELCFLSVIYLGPNYAGGNEDNGDLQKIPCKHRYTHSPQPCSRPPPTHASTGDIWTILGKFVSIFCGVIAPLSWVLVHTSFCLCPSRVYFPVLCKFWQLCGGVDDDLLQEGLCHTQVCCTQSPCPCGADPYLHRRCLNTVLSQYLWGPWVLVCTRCV